MFVTTYFASVCPFGTVTVTVKQSSLNKSRNRRVFSTQGPPCNRKYGALGRRGRVRSVPADRAEVNQTPPHSVRPDVACRGAARILQIEVTWPVAENIPCSMCECPRTHSIRSRALALGTPPLGCYQMLPAQMICGMFHSTSVRDRWSKSAKRPEAVMSAPAP